jgi:hypothetical protein
MARDLAKDMMKRKATYRNGAPKTLDVKDEDNMELAALLQERYQYIIETQEQLAFSPDKVRYLLLPYYFFFRRKLTRKDCHQFSTCHPP